MKKLVFVILASLVPVVAHAQQPQQPSISDYTLDLTQKVTQLGQAAASLQKQNETLQTQLKDANKKIEDLTKVKVPPHPPLGNATPVPPVKH